MLSIPGRRQGPEHTPRGACARFSPSRRAGAALEAGGSPSLTQRRGPAAYGVLVRTQNLSAPFEESSRWKTSTLGGRLKATRCRHSARLNSEPQEPPGPHRWPLGTGLLNALSLLGLRQHR